MSEAKHRALYEQIPAFKCVEGCTACCGPVPFSKWEWEHLKDKREAPEDKISCPYSLSGKCDIYEDRPFMCRLFGTAGGMLECPVGARPMILLADDTASDMTQKYNRMLNTENLVPTHPWIAIKAKELL